MTLSTIFESLRRVHADRHEWHYPMLSIVPRNRAPYLTPKLSRYALQAIVIPEMYVKKVGAVVFSSVKLWWLAKRFMSVREMLLLRMIDIAWNKPVDFGSASSMFPRLLHQHWLVTHSVDVYKALSFIWRSSVLYFPLRSHLSSISIPQLESDAADDFRGSKRMEPAKVIEVKNETPCVRFWTPHHPRCNGRRVRQTGTWCWSR